MNSRLSYVISFAVYMLPGLTFAQNFTKIIYDKKDTANDYYLAVPPVSGTIKGTMVLFTSFGKPESILPETKLQNVASANNILTIFASLNGSLCADSAALWRIEKIINNVISRFTADTSQFVLGGYIFAGNIILRYTELSQELPDKFTVHPKAVFAINSPVDLVELTRICGREIKKNYLPVSVNESNYLLKNLSDELGHVDEKLDNYIRLSPFYYDGPSPGNERFLKNIAVRLYYDTDINWELKNRRNGFYDTYIPGGSELIDRLLLMGNSNAEFIDSKQSGIRSDGARNPASWSVVDEVECIQWIKKQLNIFDPNTYVPEYQLSFPVGWGVERIPFPLNFAHSIKYKGMEDIRFSPKFWTDPQSDEYWSYAYLWWLNGNPDIKAGTLKQNLEDYYSGLVTRNIPIRKIPQEKLVPITASIKNIKKDSPDEQTFSGTVHILDYISQKPMVLNVVIHEKACTAQNHLALFFEVSPASPDSSVWKDLDDLWTTFNCRK